MTRADRAYVFHLISNTHWDREWYMGFEAYRWRLVKLVDRLLALYRTEPAYKSFLFDGQVGAVLDYLALRPECADEIREAVQASRLQIGPWYTQPHETLASGEALVRNLLFGLRASRRIGGATLICYTIDQFGHIAQMPQILLGFGITDVMAWRGIPQGSDSVFHWQGADGSTVFMFYSNNGYGHATALPRHLEDRTVTLDATPRHAAGLHTRVQQLLDNRTPNATTEHLLCLNGVDHSFAQEDLPEVVAMINAHYTGVTAIQSTLAEYVAAVKSTHERKGIPYTTQIGELFDRSEQILADVHSLRADQKQMNARVEDLLEKWAEPYAVLSWLCGLFPYPHAPLRKAWEYLLDNHAHDSQACSSVDSVYHAVMHRYDQAEEIATEVTEQSLRALCHFVCPATAGSTYPLILFNPLHWERSAIVTTTIDIPRAMVPSEAVPIMLDALGERPLVIHGWEDTNVVRFDPQRGHPAVIPMRRFRLSVDPGTIPGFGYKRFLFDFAPSPAPMHPALVTAPNVLANRYLRVTVRANGSLDLWDKVHDVHYTGLHHFEDGGEAGDGFEYRPPQQNEVRDSDYICAEITTICSTPLLGILQISLPFVVPARISADRMTRAHEQATCRITSRLSLTADSRRLDIDTEIDNQATDHRLRVVFPTDITNGELLVRQPFDVVRRPMMADDGYAHAQQHFVALHNTTQGLLIANKGVYEYAVYPDARQAVALTLLRCTDTLMHEIRMPLAQQPGVQHASYSLIPFGDDSSPAVYEAENYRYPLRLLACRELEEETLPGMTLPTLPEAPACGTFLQLEPLSLLISALKQHEERETVIIRVWNPSPTPVEGRVRLTPVGFTVTHAYVVNLNEERQQDAVLDREWVTFPVPGKGIVTLECAGVFTNIRE